MDLLRHLWAMATLRVHRNKEKTTGPLYLCRMPRSVWLVWGIKRSELSWVHVYVWQCNLLAWTLSQRRKTCCRKQTARCTHVRTDAHMYARIRNRDNAYSHSTWRGWSRKIIISLQISCCVCQWQDVTYQSIFGESMDKNIFFFDSLGTVWLHLIPITYVFATFPTSERVTTGLYDSRRVTGTAITLN